MQPANNILYYYGRIAFFSHICIREITGALCASAGIITTNANGAITYEIQAKKYMRMGNEASRHYYSCVYTKHPSVYNKEVLLQPRGHHCAGKARRYSPSNNTLGSKDVRLDRP